MTERTLKTAAILTAICCTLGACSREEILIETESFADKGGWVVDHEAFPKIQSAYIMAHGIGRPLIQRSSQARKSSRSVSERKSTSIGM